MSTRVMSNVFSCADEKNIKIDYQDTGSTHSNYDDVDKDFRGYKEEVWVRVSW